MYKKRDNFILKCNKARESKTVHFKSAKGDNGPLEGLFSFGFEHVLSTLFTNVYNPDCSPIKNL